jgi:hypothetical protein
MKSNTKGTKPAPKATSRATTTRTPATPPSPTRPATAPTPQRVPAAPAPSPAPERRNSAPVPAPGVATKVAAPVNGNAPDNANADITSESNYNQGHSVGEHRAEQQTATEEAAQQLRDHPTGLPLPTSGQPLTKPEPDAVNEQQ